MYTQSLDTAKPESGEAHTPTVSAAQAEAQALFTAKMRADKKVEPRDWMPDAYRKTNVRHGEISFTKSLIFFSPACCVPKTGELKSIRVVIW